VATFFCRCGHCKKLKPEYAKAAELIKYNDPPVVLAKVDCTEAGKETCNKFSVTGYPTLKIFRNGDFSQEYNGPREAGQFKLGTFDQSHQFKCWVIDPQLIDRLFEFQSLLWLFKLPLFPSCPALLIVR